MSKKRSFTSKTVEYKVKAECPGDMAVLGVIAPAGVVIRKEIEEAIIIRSRDVAQRMRETGYHCVVDDRQEIPATVVDDGGFHLVKTAYLKWRLTL